MAGEVLRAAAGAGKRHPLPELGHQRVEVPLVGLELVAAGLDVGFENIHGSSGDYTGCGMLSARRPGRAV